jgi:hypothetical protein
MIQGNLSYRAETKCETDAKRWGHKTKTTDYLNTLLHCTDSSFGRVSLRNKNITKETKQQFYMWGSLLLIFGIIALTRRHFLWYYISSEMITHYIWQKNTTYCICSQLNMCNVTAYLWLTHMISNEHMYDITSDIIWTHVWYHIWSQMNTCMISHLISDEHMYDITSDIIWTHVWYHIWSQMNTCMISHLISYEHMCDITSDLRCTRVWYLICSG